MRNKKNRLFPDRLSPLGCSIVVNVKSLISKYADVMVNVGASDLAKYAEYKKYNKNPKKKGK